MFVSLVPCKPESKAHLALGAPDVYGRYEASVILLYSFRAYAYKWVSRIACLAGAFIGLAGKLPTFGSLNMQGPCHYHSCLKFVTETMVYGIRKCGGLIKKHSVGAGDKAGALLWCIANESINANKST